MKKIWYLCLLFTNLLFAPPPPIGGYTNPITTKTTPVSSTSSTTNSTGSTTQDAPTASSVVSSLLTNPSASSDAQIRAVLSPPDVSLGGIPSKVKPGKNNQVPLAAQAASQSMGMSVTQRFNQAKTTGQLFSDAALATAYQNFIDAAEEVPSFLPLFRRIHIIALHQIYLHLVGIYTTLNMTYISDLKTYMVLEKQYGLNKKSLIINHLVNVIQAQLSQVLLTLLPGMPQSHAIKAGLATLNQDTVSNPDALVLDLEKSVLAVLKVNPLSSNDIRTLISELTGPANSGLIAANKTINQSDLTAGIAIINKYQAGDQETNTPSFIQPLVENQAAATAISEAISTILSNYTQSQTDTNYQTIISQLDSGTGNSLTGLQMATFTKTVQQLAFGIPLSEEIEAAQQFKTMIDSNDTTALSSEQVQSLQSMIGYILQNYEQQTATMLSDIINALGELNPEAQTLSPSQEISLQALASQLLLPKNPLALGAISQNDRFTLGYALHVMSVSPNYTFSSAQKATLEALGEQLQSAPLTWEELTSAQTSLLKSALGSLAAYKFEPLTQTKMQGKYTAAQQSNLASLVNQINGSSFKGFSVFSKADQLLLLQMYQNLDSVMETRLEVHKQQGQMLQAVFANNAQLQASLFASITSSQYSALNTVDKLLQANPSKFSFSMVSNQAPAPDTTTPALIPPVSPQAALASMFSIPKSTEGYTYLSILNSLQTQHFNSPTLVNLIKSISPQDQSEYDAIVPIITKQGFTFSQLSQAQRTLLTGNFQTLKSGAPSESSSTDPNSSVLTANPNYIVLQTIARIIAGTQNYGNMKGSFLWVLKQYLTFFNLYCATLQQYNSTGYSGLTTFETYAKAVVTQLQGTPLESLNPSVFFYDQATMRGIQLLPQLAKLVESTDIVPYPTFPMTLAVQGTTVDPLDGTTYSNAVTQGSFTYNKFFFLDSTQASNPTQVTTPGASPLAYQAPKEITGSLPSWITKQSVPTSGKKTTYTVEGTSGIEKQVQVADYDYIYVPNNIPSGVSGFYMNIPIFTQSATNPNEVEIRLFEQPIYAQPTWLNYPGFSATKPDSIPGVVTLLRGCLGDFQSLLDLDIFDPCMTMIFKSALALPDTSAGQTTTLQSQTSNPNMTADIQKCSAYLSAKQAEVSRMQTIHTTAAAPSTVEGQAAGGTMGMPSTGASQAASSVSAINSGASSTTAPPTPSTTSNTGATQ